MFGETLRHIMSDTLHSCIFADDYTASREIVEIMIESPLFQEVMGDDERLDVLGKMLNTAVSRGYHWWVGALLGYGADPNLRVDYKTPLKEIAYQGNSKTLDLLLAHGAWLDVNDLLTQRAYNRVEALVGDLLLRGADADAHIGKHGSPLHEAASHCFAETVWLLIHEGFADVDARDSRGYTPLLAVASESRHNDRGTVPKHPIMMLLFQGGASVHAVDDKGRSGFHHVLQSRSEKCLRVCLERGADPNLRDTNGQTPMAALLARTQHDVFGAMAEMFGELLRAGADPFIRDNNGVSAAEMLATTESGREYLEEEAVFFRS